MHDWMKNLILSFRQEYQKLSESEKNKVSNLDNLIPPLQVEIISIKNQQLGLENHLFIFTHFEDKEDLKITVHDFEFQEAIEKLPGILKDKKWDRKLPVDSKWLAVDKTKKTYAGIIEHYLVNLPTNFKEDIINHVLHKPRKNIAKISLKTYLEKDAFIWQAVGNIKQLDFKEITGKIIEETKKTKTKPKPHPVLLPQVARIKGFGTYFYPPIWIGEKPQPSFKEKVFDQKLKSFSKKSFDAEYKGHKIVLNEDGFIAIGIENKKKALRMLNEIMGTALLLNVSSYAIRESELGEVGIDSVKLQIANMTISIDVSPRTSLSVAELIPLTNSRLFTRKAQELSKERLIRIITQAELLTKNEMRADFLTYLVESYTYLQASEANQSFIMSWLIVEQYLSFRWKNFLQKKKIVGKKRKDKLEDWTVGLFLEALNFAKEITNKQYKSLIEMKRKRDKFVHKGQPILEEDAIKCFKLCVSIVQRHKRSINPF